MSRLILAGFVLASGAAALAADAAPKGKPAQLPPRLVEALKASPDEFLKRFDRNGDGFLSREELPPRLAQAFDRFDTNGDGKLDRQEIGQMLQRLRRRFGITTQPAANGPDPDRVVDRILRRMDANHDGKISREEAVNQVARFFDQIDTNKDGFLDRQELRRAVGRFLAAGKGNPGQGKPGEPPGAAGGSVPDFDALDADADGRLTRDEVKGTPLADLFDRIDTNRDGKIDRKEFDEFFNRTSKGSGSR